MELNYIIDKKNFKIFLKKHIKTTKIAKSINAIFFITMLVALTILSIIVAHDTVVLFLLQLILFLIFFKKITISRELYVLFVKSSPYSFLFNETKLILYEDGLNRVQEYQDEYFYWNSVLSLHLVDKYILIITSFKNEIFIPVTAFKNNNEMLIFIEKISKNSNVELQKTFPSDYVLPSK